MRHVKTSTVMLLTVALISLSLQVDAAPRRTNLARRPFTVIAVVDSGINPYHDDFQRPELTMHPSRYIEGFPSDVPALDLSLDATSYNEAVNKDRAKWNKLGSEELAWIPGTNIIGAMSVTDDSILDEIGHGTPVASLAAGGIHGPASDDLLIVALEGFSKAVKWAAEQPWIDVITNSWLEVTNDPRTTAEISRKAVAAGKIVCFASGNFAVPLWAAGTQGPSWHVNVGAASNKTRGEHAYTGYPNDVLGPSHLAAATSTSIDGEENFAGTSAATPNVCGEMAKVLSQVRAALRDYTAGPGAGLARGAGKRGPYLQDGCLDRTELEEVIQATARPAEPSPPDPEDTYAIPAAPAVGFLRGGYGIVDHDSGKQALRVLLGREPKPERELEDTWIATTDRMRDAVYGEAPPAKGC